MRKLVVTAAPERPDDEDNGGEDEGRVLFWEGITETGRLWGANDEKAKKQEDHHYNHDRGTYDNH